MMQEGKIHGSVTRARAFFQANPRAELTHEQFRERFGFTNAECARQGLYMLHLEGVAHGVQVVRAVSNAPPVPDPREPFIAELSVLSQRQLEVLMLGAKGMTAQEIGAYLGMSKSTADVHRTTALARLGCTFPEAIVTLTKAGYV